MISSRHYISYMSKFNEVVRARRLVRTGCCSSFTKREHKPPKPVVVGSKPTGPAIPASYKSQRLLLK